MYKNLNFRSNILSFGFNIHYSFKPWLKNKFFEPFVSLGIETLQFDTKADYSYVLNGKNGRYYYWTDGTIRDAPQDVNPFANIVPRSFVYDTDLRRKNQSGLGNYSQFTVAFPIDIGIDFKVSNRVSLRAATSLHYALTNSIDDLSSKANNPKIPDYKGSSRHNMFTYSYLSIHFDIFSSDLLITEELLSADFEMDIAFYDDEDGDFVFDGWDECPDTPMGWPVDSIGCPFDTDGDGVPDEIDLEPNSRPGAIVDEYGVEITEEAFFEHLNSMVAIRRSEVTAFLLMQRAHGKMRRTEPLPIPDKFRRLDTNNDRYISFEEYMKAINDFFDGNSTYTPNDLRELNDFFFDQ